jgi:hypothetical protein
MKHATAQALDRVSTLLDGLRKLAALQEKACGVYYLKSRAFLHFHEDNGSVYADVRLDDVEFERFCVDTLASQRRLLAAIRSKLITSKKVLASRSIGLRVKPASGQRRHSVS